MKNLKLSKQISLPLDIVTQTIAILAKRRAGKSYTMRKLVEQLLTCNQQVVMVDPKGDQWGIRSGADGKKPGYPLIIFGGEHADVPLEANAGEMVAKLVVEERVSILLDLSFFRKHEVATFMGIFLENLYRLKAQEKYRTPVMLVIDEADAIAPQKPQKGEERMLGAAEDIVRRGGQRGIGCALITQRSAVLNKNVLTQAQMLVVLRTIAPQDLSAMKAWIDVHGDYHQGKTLMDSLPSLPIGDAWFWSPGWPTTEGIFARTHILPIETFDSGATPKPGQKAVVPKNLADVNLDVLKEKMAATIEKAKADNPVILKSRIAELEKQIKKQPTVLTVKADAAMGVSQWFEYGKKYGYDKFWEMKTVKEKDQEITEIKKVHAMNVKFIDAVYKNMSQIHKLSEMNKTDIPGISKRLIPMRYSDTNERPIVREVMFGSPRLKMPSQKKIDTVYFPPPQPTDSSISGPEQRILDAIAWQHSIGIDEPEQTAVAFLAGYTYGGGGFNNPRGALKTKGLVEYLTNNRIRLTEAGGALARVPETALTTQELHRKVLNLLPGPESKLLVSLLNIYPESMTNEELAEASGYKNGSGGFNNPKGRLRTLGLVEYPEPGKIRARSILFL